MNRLSKKLALSVLAMHQGRRVAVLGDMAELGDGADEYHRALGNELMKMNIERLYAVGPLSEFTVQAFGDGAFHFQTKEALQTQLLSDLKQDCKEAALPMVLVKGSRSAGMEVFAQAIEEEF